MRLRVRHLNPARAGAQVALDARYITGISSGAAVQTWPARANTTISADQGTTASRPTMSAINGAQALNFDGVDDAMNFSAGGLSLTNAQSSLWATAVASCDAVGDATQVVVWISNGTATGNSRASTRSYNASAFSASATGRRQDADASAAVSGTVGNTGVPCILGGMFDWSGNSVRASCNGVESTGTAYSSGAGTQSATDALSARIGALSTTSSRHKGRIGAVILACPIPSNSVRKMIRNHLGFSFRIATA